MSPYACDNAGEHVQRFGLHAGVHQHRLYLKQLVPDYLAPELADYSAQYDDGRYGHK